MKEIYKEILKLVSYGLEKKMIGEYDIDYAINSYLSIYGLDEPDCDLTLKDVSGCKDDLDTILNNLLDIAEEKGIIESGSIVYRDLFDTVLMGVMTARPSEITQKFYSLYKECGRNKRLFSIFTCTRIGIKTNRFNNK